MRLEFNPPPSLGPKGFHASHSPCPISRMKASFQTLDKPHPMMHSH